MATTNDVTGDSISSKVNSQAYMDNWDRIFQKKKQEQAEKDVPDEEKDEKNVKAP